jgi:hypothetical protein
LTNDFALQAEHDTGDEGIGHQADQDDRQWQQKEPCQLPVAAEDAPRRSPPRLVMDWGDALVRT